MIQNVKKLGEIADVRDGTHDSPKQKEFGKPLITSKHIKGGKIDLQSAYLISIEDFDKINKRSKVDKWDILFSMIGTIGEMVIVENEIDFAIKNVGLFKTGDEKLSKWIYYYLKSPEAQKEIEASLKGSTQQYISLTDLRNFPIQILPTNQRNQIIEILSSLDDKIELNNQINQNLEALAQALFKQWFVDFEFPNENSEPYKSSGGEMIDSELGEIPKGWEVYRLKELLTIKRGGSPRPIQDFMADSGLPWVKISDATAINNPFLFETKEFIKHEGLRKTVLMKKGSLILSNSATPGLPIFLELDACIHDGWLHFQDIKLLSYNFLYLFFLEIRKDLVGKGNGSIFINLKTDILKEYQISVSTPEVLSRFNKVIDPIFENIKQVALENRNLIKLRDTILPNLISGELEVNESLLEPTF
jgi:type I restriction enzyme S subunit